MSRVDVLAVMTSVAARTPKHDDMLALDEARAAVEELVECYDAMLSRWWLNDTQANKALANRAANARRRFAGLSPSPEPPVDEYLSESRRGEK